jgi:hypothetical protein
MTLFYALGYLWEGAEEQNKPPHIPKKLNIPIILASRRHQGLLGEGLFTIRTNRAF